MSEYFDVNSLMAKTTAVPVPPFTIKSSGENTTAINDWYDLDELFQGNLSQLADKIELLYLNYLAYL